MPADVPRAFKTHSAPPMIPFFKQGEGPNVKYIVVARNPEESLVSFYPFLKKHNPEFIKLYGLPENMFNSFPSFEVFMDFIGGTAMGMLFGFMKGTCLISDRCDYHMQRNNLLPRRLMLLLTHLQPLHLIRMVGSSTRIQCAFLTLHRYEKGNGVSCSHSDLFFFFFCGNKGCLTSLILLSCRIMMGPSARLLILLERNQKKISGKTFWSTQASLGWRSMSASLRARRWLSPTFCWKELWSEKVNEKQRFKGGMWSRCGSTSAVINILLRLVLAFTSLLLTFVFLLLPLRRPIWLCLRGWHDPSCVRQGEGFRRKDARSGGAGVVLQWRSSSQVRWRPLYE